MQEPASEGPEDWFFDEQQQCWLRHSGVARAKRVLTEHRQQSRTTQAKTARQAFLARYGLKISDAGRAQVTRPIDGPKPLVRICGPRGYSEGMEQNTRDRLTADEVDARMGWTITDEGKARARRQLDGARDVDWAAMRAEVGLPARPSRA